MNLLDSDPTDPYSIHMANATVELLKFSVYDMPRGQTLQGSYGYVPADGGSESVKQPASGYLGAEPILGTVTGALRQFNLPTSRAPGDWPEPTVHTVRY
jgi:hypothetical protein